MKAGHCSKRAGGPVCEPARLQGAAAFGAAPGSSAKSGSGRQEARCVLERGVRSNRGRDCRQLYR